MTTLWENTASARAEISRRAELNKRDRWLVEFRRMVRVANWQLNVEHRWPRKDSRMDDDLGLLDFLSVEQAIRLSDTLTKIFGEMVDILDQPK